jgi:hypothetical protein
MQTVGLGFSRKSHLYAGVTARGVSSVQNTPGPAGLTFRKERRAGIWPDHWCIIMSQDITKRYHVEPVKAPQIILGNLGSFGD